MLKFASENNCCVLEWRECIVSSFLLYPLFHPNEDDMFVMQIVVVDHADVILMQVRFEV
jgi:hypothetical protein